MAQVARPEDPVVNLTISSGAAVSESVYVGYPFKFLLLVVTGTSVSGNLAFQTCLDTAAPTGGSTWYWLRVPDASGGLTAGEVYNIASPTNGSGYPLNADIVTARHVRLAIVTLASIGSSPPAVATQASGGLAFSLYRRQE